MFLIIQNAVTLTLTFEIRDYLTLILHISDCKLFKVYCTVDGKSGSVLYCRPKHWLHALIYIYILAMRP